METTVTHIGILMNGKIVNEESTENLMKKYNASNMKDLFIEIIYSEDNQRDPSSRAGKLFSVKSPITLEDTSPLNSIFTTQSDTSKKLVNTYVILHALIMKNIFILAGIHWTSLAELTCTLLLPLIVHAAFARYPQRTAEMVVHNHETCDGVPDAAAGDGMPMSCAFVRQYLARSFHLMYVTSEDHAALRIDDFECLLRINHNYTEALLRRIERKITNQVDFEDSQILITMKIADGRKAAHVKDQLISLYSEFLLGYVHKLKNNVTDINFDSIKVTLTYCGDLRKQIVLIDHFTQQYDYTPAYEDNDGYYTYGQFVNSGLIVVLAFFVHASIAVWLRQQVANDDNYYSKWTLYLSHLAVQIPIAAFGNTIMVTQMVMLYDIRIHHGYVFLCLLFESIYGIHLGYVLCSIVKNDNSITLILYLGFTAYAYASGLWWPTKKFSWWNVIIDNMPLTEGISFVRNERKNQYFVINSLFILSCWVIILVVITVIDINITKFRNFFY